MKKPAEPLAAKVRRLRESKGWSLRELARRVGVTHPAIDKIERGADPNWSIVQRLADALGVDVQDLR